jgi:uncharacterized protein (UPF0276 family)
MHFTELPKLGIGLGADVSSVSPNFRAFIDNGVDSIDYLNFGAHFSQQRRVRHYIGDLIDGGFPLVFHPINFNTALADQEHPTYVDSLPSIARDASALWAGQDIGVWTHGGQYLGAYLLPVILDDASAHAVAEKIRTLDDMFHCPFAVENPPVYFSLERMHMLDFMSLVSEEADCGLVLDIGHLIGYQQATGRELNDMPLERFPFDRVIEVHLAGLEFSYSGDDTAIIDRHSAPIHELCWEWFTANARQMTSLKGITLEQEYGDNEMVLAHLRKARGISDDLGLFTRAT